MTQNQRLSKLRMLVRLLAPELSTQGETLAISLLRDLLADAATRLYYRDAS